LFCTGIYQVNIAKKTIEKIAKRIFDTNNFMCQTNRSRSEDKNAEGEDCGIEKGRGCRCCRVAMVEKGAQRIKSA
jgi:hypothetical protein